MASTYGTALVIDASASESNEILLNGADLVNLRVAAWTAAGLFIKFRMDASDSLGPQAFLGADGSLSFIKISAADMALIVATGHSITLDPALFIGAYSFSIASGVPGTEVNQGSERVFTYRASKVL